MRNKTFFFKSLSSERNIKNVIDRKIAIDSDFIH